MNIMPTHKSLEAHGAAHNHAHAENTKGLKSTHNTILAILGAALIAASSAALAFAISTTRDNARQDQQISSIEKLLAKMDQKLDTLISQPPR